MERSIAKSGIGWIVACLLLAGCQEQNETVYQGYVEARLVYLASPYGGKLKELPVVRGEPITSQQMLFLLDSDAEILDVATARSQVAESMGQLKDLQTGLRPSEIAAIKAQLNQVEKELAFAEQELQRHKQLVAKEVVSQQTYEQVTTNYLTTKARLENLTAELTTAQLPARDERIKAAHAKVEQSQSQLAKAQWVLQQKFEVAQHEGYIYDTYYRVGEYVPQGSPVVSMLTPDDVKVIFYVPERALSGLALQQPVVLQCDHCAQPVSAKISFISQEAEFTPPVIYSKSTRDKLMFRVEADFVEKSNLPLLPGQPVDIYFSQREQA